MAACLGGRGGLRSNWAARVAAAAVGAAIVTACAGDDGQPPGANTDVAEDAGIDDAGFDTERTDQESPDPQHDETTSGGGFFSQPVIEEIDGVSAGQVASVIAQISVGETVSYAGFDIRITEVLVGLDPVGFAVAQVNVDLLNRTPVGHA